MPRLLPCPSCGRHLRATEARCRFCGATELTIEAPVARLGTLLLGLSLAACTGQSAGEEGAGAAPDSATTAPASAPAPAPEPPAEPDPGPEAKPEPEPGDTAADAANGDTTGDAAADGTTGEGVTDDGASTEEPPEAETKPTKMKTKYGGPRPPAKKKYGGPRPDDLGPLDDL